MNRESKGCFKYDLKVENFNKLIKKSLDPTFLIVVLVAEDIKEGLCVHEVKKETWLKHCAYWVSLQGMPKTDNKGTIRIEIPQKQLLTKEALDNIMQKAAEKRKRLIGI